MKNKIKLVTLSLLLLVALSGCAGWNRFKKSFVSNMDNGLNREVTVFSRDGEILFHDEGKFDIEVSETRIKYINEKGKLIIFYLGNSASALVEEK